MIVSTNRLIPALLLAAMWWVAVGCETNSMIRSDGQAALRTGDAEEARGHFARAADRVPEDFKAQYYLGVSELKLGRPLEAGVALERAMVLTPGSPVWRARVNDAYAEALFQREAYPELFTFLREAGEDEGTVGAQLRMGKYHRKAGDPDAAIAAYTAAAAMAEPGDARAYLALVELYEEANDPERTLEYLGYVYYISPGEPSLERRFERLGKVFGPTLKRKPPGEGGGPTG